MANRFPLIVDSSALQIKELPASDNLDLASSGIVNASSISATSLTIVDSTVTGGINASGVITASSFSGTVATATNASGLTGTPSITVADITGIGANLTGVITATSGSFSGNISVGGTLTYEDVTNVDSLGIVTARNGVRVTAGGINVTAGISSLTGVDFAGSLKEGVKITAGKLSDNTEINLSNGMVHLFTTAESTTSTPNIMSTTGINTDMSVGESISVTIITTANASAYSANITIDSVAVTERWIGGSAPTSGGSSGNDIHAFTIIKTGDAAYTVLGNYSNAA